MLHEGALKRSVITVTVEVQAARVAHTMPCQVAPLRSVAGAAVGARFHIRAAVVGGVLLHARVFLAARGLDAGRGGLPLLLWLSDAAVVVTCCCH